MRRRSIYVYSSSTPPQTFIGDMSRDCRDGGKRIRKRACRRERKGEKR
jgi:hypothetical protein